ncbi:MAG: MFS transporter [Lachnospiraceae bacterium]|jgi:MFS family permease|nr:MFS transporter [Lachnospiraceae bacterium]
MKVQQENDLCKKNNNGSLKQQLIYLILMICVWFAEYSYTPYLVPYLKDLNSSYTVIGFVLASYGLFQMILRIPIGLLADRAGRMKAFLIIEMATLVVASFFLAFARNPIMILLGRTLTGVSSSFWICFIALYQGNYEAEKKVRGASTITAITSLGKMLGVLAALILFTYVSIRSIFLASFLATIPAFIAVFWLKETKVTHGQFAFRDVFALLRNKMLIRCSFIIMLDQMVVFSTVYSYSSDLIEKQAGEAFIGPASFLLLFGMGVFPLLSTFVLSKYISNRKLLFIYFSAFISYILILPNVKSGLLILLLSFIAGAASASLFGILMGLASSTVDKKHRTLAVGIFQTAVAIGMTAGPPIFSLIMEKTNAKIGFLSTALLLIVCLLLQINVFAK